MDSVANWESLECSRLRQNSPAWTSSGILSAGSADAGSLGRGLDFSEISNFGFDPAKLSNFNETTQFPELNGMVQQSQLMKLQSQLNQSSYGGPMTSAIHKAPSGPEFGQWKPIHDDSSSQPTLSLTGTEIWASQKTSKPATSEGTGTSEWNLKDMSAVGSIGSDSLSSFSKADGQSVGKLETSDVDELGWPDLNASIDRHVDEADLRTGIELNTDSNAGWGRTAVCQDKPWDLNQDGAVLEPRTVLSLPTILREQEARDLVRDGCLDAWKNVLFGGDVSGVPDIRKARVFESQPVENLLKSDVSDASLLLGLQKLDSLGEIHSSESLAQSRRGSSVSSVDGMSNMVGRSEKKDLGWETNAPAWTDQTQNDDWNLVTSAVLRQSSLQSPTWCISGIEKNPSIDDGTAIWSKAASQEKTSDPWGKMTKTPVYTPPLPPFNIDVSVPPPPLNNRHPLSLGIMPPSTTVNRGPMLGNFHSPNNPLAERLNSSSPLDCLTSGRLNSVSVAKERPWSSFPTQHLGQKPWTGSQWPNSDSWNSMQRKGTNIVLNRAPQTRSKLLQQLVNMGFKKEDAQHALISYNMDLEKALGDLMAKQRQSVMSFDLPQSSGIGGRMQMNMEDNKDVLRSTLGGLSGHGGSGASSLEASLDLKKRISNPPGLDILMQTADNPQQMLSSARNHPTMMLPSLPQQFLHSSLLPQNLPPGLSLPRNRMPLVDTEELLQISEKLALQKKLATGGGGLGHNLDQTETELLQLFARQLSMTDSNARQAAGSSGGSVFQPDIRPRSSLNLPENPNGKMNPYFNQLITSGSAAQVPMEHNIQNELNFDSLALSFGGHQVFPSITQAHQAVTSTSPDPGKYDSAPSLTSKANMNLLTSDKRIQTLEIKEFIPGVPWKSVQASALPKTSTPPPSEEPVSGPNLDGPETEVAWAGKDSDEVVSEGTVQKSLPSKWIQLKNISTELNDAELHDLCVKHGKVKIFTREDDRSALISYVELDGAVRAKEALDQLDLNGCKLTAEYVKDWTAAADNSSDLNTANEMSSTDELGSSTDELGYMTPGGLWIPPDSNGTVYYNSTDGWNEEFGGQAADGKSSFDSNAEDSDYLPNELQD